jgi:hypothetical protein
MNSNTKEKLIEFIEAVEGLALAVSSFAGFNEVSKVLTAGKMLRDQLESDETIV